MKIPDTTANVGAYYGNEENGQWQPNGVIVESGGAVGGGDARPIYPVHVPRNHIPGYVMAGPYYGGGGVAYSGVGGVPPHAHPAHPAHPAHTGHPAHPAHPAAPPDDFEDYMWMENEEEFDKQVMQQLEEEALMEQCIEAMLEDEQREARHRPSNGHYPTTSNGNPLSLEETVSRSTLNPLAAEFVPTFRPAPPPGGNTEDKSEQPPAEAPTEPPSPPSPPQPASTPETPPPHAAAPPDAAPADKPSEDSAEAPETESTQQELETPEVSAADLNINIINDKTKHDKKKQETRKAPPQDKKQPEKKRPQTVKSDTKIQQQFKKKEVKSVRSEGRVSESGTQDEHSDANTNTSKPSPQTIEDPLIPKPINYAAAAKANKPKKLNSVPSVTEKTPPPVEKPKKPTEKPTVKPEKPMQRKNSAK